MIAQKFKPVGKEDDFKDIAWNNVVEASKAHSLSVVLTPVIAWACEHPESSFQDLEMKLRENNVDLAIIADVNKTYDFPNSEVRSPFDISLKKKYGIILSCRPQEYALKEVLEHSKDYDTNFNLLNDCGILGDKFKEEPEKGTTFRDLKKGNPDDPTTKILEAKVRMTIDIISNERMTEMLNEDINKAMKKTGEEPQTALFGMAHDGSGVFAFSHEGKCISQFGMMMGFNREGKQCCKTVLLTDKGSWSGFM